MAKKKEEPEVDSKLKNLMDAVAKNVGKEKLKLLTQEFERQECASFGLPSLDAALNGGIPKGNMLELFGADGCGKTHLGLHLLGNQAKNGHTVIPIDAEHKLDLGLAAQLGVDMTKHPYAQPRTAEEAFDIILSASEHMSEGDAILVDSTAALSPKSEIEGEMDKSLVGGNARVVAHGLRKIMHSVSEHRVVVVFVNQMRDKIGVMWGPTTTTPCGRALKHFCGTRLEVVRGSMIKDNDKIIGQEVRVKIVQATHCHPFVVVPLKLFFGHGFSKEYSLLDLALSQGIIKQSSAWYMYGDQKFHGQSDLVKYLYTDKGYADMLSKVKI